MRTFINQVVDELIQFEQRNLLIIVPTRRSGILIKQQLARDLKKNSWLPTIIPIADLIAYLCPTPIANDLDLFFTLFETYKNQDNEITLDEFFNWGSQVIDDFNEIDNHLIKADELFKKVANIKELENLFLPDSEEINYLNKFWLQFSELPLSPLKKEFIDYWNKFPSIYKEFNILLDKKNIAYEGKAWKFAANNIKNNKWINEFSQVAFVGFYALTKAEEKIIQYFIDKGNASIYKDADQFYTEPKHQEAGMFFRKGLLANKNLNWTNSYLLSTPKQVEIISSAGKSAMARKLASTVTNKLSSIDPKEYNQTIVVLPDESLLFTFLSELSKSGIASNPSMGFPINHHPIINLINSILIYRIQLNEIGRSNQESDAYKNIIENAIILKWLNLETHKENNDALLILNSLLNEKSATIIEEITLLELFLSKLVNLEEQYFTGFYNILYNNVKIIIEQLRNYNDQLTIKSWYKLFFENLSKIRFPFSSNQENGIQVMGFLETRVMDFKYIFIASLNEGTLPSSNISQSMIPYSLRKAYQLPCKEEKDAITSYHFYRLLQRAEFITLLYNSELNDLGGGEKSRYLLQIHYELSKLNPTINISYLQENNIPLPPSIRKIEVFKTEHILNRLNEKYTTNSFENLKGIGFSASSLSSYVSCSLKFYFEQIADLKMNVQSEQLDPIMFGKVLHKCMENLYANNSTITDAFLDDKISEISEKLVSAIKTEYKNSPLHGNDLLMFIALEELVKRIIFEDKKNTPFSIIGLEKELFITINTKYTKNILVKGIIDRIDLKDQEYKIIDYKTGNDKFTFPKIFNRLFDNPDYKVSFQLMLYQYLFSFNNENKLVKSGIYKLKKSNEGFLYLNKGNVFDENQWEDFKNGLEHLIEDIFNPKIPFSQTDDLTRCRNCDFKGICNRLV